MYFNIFQVNTITNTYWLPTPTLFPMLPYSSFRTQTCFALSTIIHLVIHQFLTEYGFSSNHAFLGRHGGVFLFLHWPILFESPNYLNILRSMRPIKIILTTHSLIAHTSQPYNKVESNTSSTFPYFLQHEPYVEFITFTLSSFSL